MPRHRKYKRKGGGREARKKKMRPQDPFNTRPMEEKNGSDAAPKGNDLDMFDIPAMPARRCMPDDGDPAAKAKAKAKPEGSRNRKRKRGADKAASARTEEGTKREAADERKPAQSSLPNQLPGESARAYRIRLEKSTRQRLKEVSAKTNTEHKREKQRARAQAKKEADREKAKKRTEKKAAGLPAEVEKPKFGDVIQRPPELGAAALKSRSKLKGSLKASVPGGASNLVDYAAKVKEAYEQMKRRRLEQRQVPR